MTPAKRYETSHPGMLDSKLCHRCHKNKLDPTKRYFLLDGIEVCK